MLGAISAQRPASQTAIGMQVERADEQRDDGGRDHQRAQERPDAVGGEHVGPEWADRATPVDFDERARRRCLGEAEAEERQRSADRQHEEAEQPTRSAAGLDAEDVGAMHQERLQERDQEPDRDEQDPDPEH